MNAPEIVQELSKGEECSADFLQKGLASARELLARQAEIRVYLDGTPNFGHQATTIQLLKRLVDDFGFLKLATIVYRKSEKGPPALTATQKLALLLTEFDPATLKPIKYNGCTFQFLEWDQRGTLKPSPVLLGFTGGADDDKLNLAQELTVTQFLRLQPYRWKAGSAFVPNRIEFLDGRIADIANRQLPLLPYRFKAATAGRIEPGDWDWYEKGTTDAGLAARTRAAHDLLRALEGSSARLWPAYGLHQFPPGEARSGRDVLLSTAIAGLDCQRRAGFNGGPIVLTLLNLPARDTLGFLEAFKAGNTKAIVDELREGYLHTRPPASWTAALAGIEADLLALGKELEPGRRLTIGVPDNNRDWITPLIRAAKPGDVVVLPLGPLPQVVFNALYANAALPSIFEGQGSSSLPISLGRPYLQIPKSGAGGAQNYPEALALATAVSPVAQQCGTVVEALRLEFYDYIVNSQLPRYRTNIETIGGFLTSCYEHTSPLAAYFASLGAYYQQDAHDKLALALAYFIATATSTSEDRQQLALRAGAPAAAGTLDEIYDALLGAWQPSSKSLDLLAALPTSSLAAFYRPVTGRGLVVAVPSSDYIAKQTGTDGKTVAVVLAPPSAAQPPARTSAFGPMFDFEAHFSAALDVVQSRTSARLPDTWGLPGAPWLGLAHPGLQMTVSEAGVPVQGGFITQVKGTDLTVQVSYPVEQDTWVITGTVEQVLGIASFFAMAGGSNLVALLPAPLNSFADFGLKSAQVVYDADHNKIASIVLALRSNTPWVFLAKPKLQFVPAIDVTVNAPGDLASRSYRFDIYGQLTIGAGTLSLSARYPDFELNGTLSAGEIAIQNLLALFGADVQLDAAVTALTLQLAPGTGQYSISSTVVPTDPKGWAVPASSPVIAVASLSFEVQSTAAGNHIGFSGSTAILPHSANIPVDVAASYDSADGWTFELRVPDRDPNPLTLRALLKEYLDWELGGGSDYGIGGLALTVKNPSEGPGSWRFEARTDKPWEIPFLPDLSVAAAVVLANNWDGADGSSGRVELALKGKPGAGLLARVDVTVWFDYAPGTRQYGLRWGVLSATLTNTGKGIWTAELTLGDATVGSLIEEMVSWVTGSRFSLSAPWNILDSISLSGLALTYTFDASDKSKNTIGFKVKVGPIDLGFARIEALDVSYRSSGDAPGVMVTLEGFFPWNVGEDGDTGKLGPWDTSSPGTAPAPPGNGNKYLDLRLLAMGQHVTVEGITAAKTVQQAIECLSKLPKTKGDELPAVVFDAQSSWLIGADFGVLRLEEPGGDGAASYFLTVQVVFNDPHLYGLRIALAGAPARVLKDLDFQVMYRQIGPTVGVYQAEIALPDIMRHFELGACSITLPIFAVAIYTNGDFLIDVGFPWNQDFSRSLRIEAIVAPGIPVLGSAGLYFGKLSSATTDKVPAATTGSFNPVIVFGFGLQVGFGKSVEYGILKAGFSVTVMGIIEGVLAKWNPYQPQLTAGAGDSAQLQESYYFALQGAIGIQGRLYGSIDFSVVKAEVNIELRLVLQFTYESYVSISMTVLAAVDVSVSISISLGLFTIHLKLHFALQLKETFTIDNPGTPPWGRDGDTGAVAGAPPRGLLRRPPESRLTHLRTPDAPLRAPDWGNLQPAAAPLPQLSGYLTTGLTLARDEWTAAQSQVCVVVMLAIDAPDPTVTQAPSAPSGPGAMVSPQAPEAPASAMAPDSGFDVLCKSVLRWVLAAVGEGPVTAAELDAKRVSDVELQRLLNETLASSAATPMPIPPAAIEEFLHRQLELRVTAASKQGAAAAAFFPAPPGLSVKVPAANWDYTLASFNAISDAGLALLRSYFEQLAVQVAEEQGESDTRTEDLPGTALSVASWVFADYFLLLARQLVQALRSGLRRFSYPIEAGQTIGGICADINARAGLDDEYTAADLFIANSGHPLRAGRSLTVPGTPYRALTGDSFAAIAALPRFAGAFDAGAVALTSAALAILRAGAQIDYPGKGSYAVAPRDCLNDVAGHFAVDVAQLLHDVPTLLSSDELIATGALLELPRFPYATKEGDTLAQVAARFGLDPGQLGDAVDPGLADLFATQDAERRPAPDLEVPHLPAYEIGALIAEAQRSLAFQNLAGMASRFFFHGLRLPTEQIAPSTPGMWVKPVGGKLTLPPLAGLYALTGQQLPLPGKVTTKLTVASIGSGEPWLVLLDGGGNPATTLDITIDPSEAGGQRDAARIAALCDAALPLPSGLTELGVGAVSASHPAKYALASSIAWQSAAAVALPYGSPADPQALRIWPFPDALVNLPDPATRAENPRMRPRLARYEEASGATATPPIASYGWATAISFEVKRSTDPSATGPAAHTYQILGVADRDIVLLERLVAQVGDDDARIDRLIVAYPPDAAGAAPAGLCTDPTDPAGNVTFGIAQVDLSTETRPSGGRSTPRAAALTAPAGVGLLNGKAALPRLLWQASIGRNGGFYLFYYDAADARGLPDRIFDDNQRANLTLLVLHARPAVATERNRVTNYMNALLTGESIDPTATTVYLEADPLVDPPAQIAPPPDASLGGLAYAYFSDVGDLAAANAALALSPLARLVVSQGAYQAPPGAGIALQALADAVQSTVAALRAANPGVTLPDPLCYPMAIDLPRLELVPGSSPHAGTLADIAGFYGESVVALAAENAAVAPCFAAGQTVTIPGGPTVRAATVPPGVEALHASRPVPPAIPEPSDPAFARTFLAHTYSLLGCRVAPNVGFATSNIAVPVGPTTEPPESAGWDKRRVPRALAAGEPWSYRRALPYAQFAKPLAPGPFTEAPAGGRLVDPPAGSPYLGVGSLLQVEFDLHDLYGNTLASDLSSPTATTHPLNQAPLRVGYSDALLALAQWPSVGASYRILPGSTGSTGSTGGTGSTGSTGGWRIMLTLGFDTSRYKDSAAADRERSGATKAADRARADLRTYVRLREQLLDPAGIAYAIQSSLLQGSGGEPGRVALGAGEVAALHTWLFDAASGILGYLEVVARGETPTKEPSATLALGADGLGLAQLCAEEIFELGLSLRIARTGGIVAGELESTPGIREAVTDVPPYQQELAPPQDTTRALTQFALDLEAALSVAGEYRLKLATGVDRHRVTTASSGSTLWAVRVGATPAQPIAYSLRTGPAGRPLSSIFAPRPVSTSLQSATAQIHDYKTGEGIAGSGHAVDFAEQDLDDWCRQLFAAVDAVLAPRYTGAMQILYARDGRPGPRSYLDRLLAVKQALAKVAAELMCPVFEGELADPGPAREAFRQSLLARLSNAYAVRAAIQFEADVQAAIDEEVAPQLFGDVVDGTPAPTPLSFSSPKLALATGTQPLTFLMSGPDQVSDSAGALVPYVELDLAYGASAIEHQIQAKSDHVVDGYRTSSWLTFVIREDISPLDADLGELQVPIVLRGYPTVPSLAAQAGGGTGAGENLSEIRRWNYSFTYALPFHYPQDRVEGSVEFNLGHAPRRLGDFADAFGALAEFVTVNAAIQADLERYLAAFDATTTDPEVQKNASAALGAFLQVVEAVAAAVGDGGGLRFESAPARRVGDPLLTFAFQIEEGALAIAAVEALLVTLTGPLPAGIAAARVCVGGESYRPVPPPEGEPADEQVGGRDPNTRRFVYESTTAPGTYLPAREGQQLAERVVELEGMDILQRQDAEPSIYIQRNKILVPERPTAAEFVYQTPPVRPTGPLCPTIDSSAVISIADIGTPPPPRSLEAHFQALFAALLAANTEPTLFLQARFAYDYSLNAALGPLELPVLMQAPLLIDVSAGANGPGSLAAMIDEWSTAIRSWFEAETPLGGGTLWLDLLALSNQTERPLPLLRLRRLCLALDEVLPPLAGAPCGPIVKTMSST